MMTRRILLTFLCALILSAGLRSGFGEDASAKKSVYLIGNSLTWDTVPSRLDGNVQWHVDCGKSLPFMFANPEEPCVKTSTLWPKALKENRYDILSLQTHYGATLAEDVETISSWIEMQPQAVVVIHTGWAHHAKRKAEYSSKDATGKMQHSPVYVQELLKALRKKYPARKFRQTHAIDLLARIASDIEQGKSPLKDLVELHRDKIHMKLDSGRYLMHNAMRHALGQPASNRGFEKLEPKLKQYLDGILKTLPKTDGVEIDEAEGDD